MNRLKDLLGITQHNEDLLASTLGIPVEIVFDWETGRYPIDEENLKRICEHFAVLPGYIKGASYRLRNPIEHWEKTLRDDYYRSDAAIRVYLECKHGSPIFLEGADEFSFSPPRYALSLVGRNGEKRELHLTDAQIARLHTFLDNCEEENQD